MTNPYRVNNPNREFRRSAICFLDLLGYQAAFAAKAEDQLAAFHHIHDAMTQAREWLDWADDEVHARPYELKVFTDNIVIGWPIDGDGETELGFLIDSIQAFQLTLVTNGVFARGAVAVGDLYIDDLGVFGPGLLDAYRGESQLAVDPRVVLTASAQESVKAHLQSYPDDTWSPQKLDILRDVDGQWFVNYLQAVMHEPEYGPDLYELNRHKAAVETSLSAHVAQPRIWSKYEWVARYHNHYCQMKEIDSSYKINIEQLRANFGDIG